MYKEFKKFIDRGNVVDLAVGVVLATYFGAIVKSLVADIIMPPIGLLIGDMDFVNLKLILKKAIPAVIDSSGNILTPEVPAVAILYGAFINTVITFLIVAFAIFIAVKQYNKFKEGLFKKEKEADPEPTKEEKLLTEIRDLLKNNSVNK